MASVSPSAEHLGYCLSDSDDDDSGEGPPLTREQLQQKLELAAERILECLKPCNSPISMKGPGLADSIAFTQKLHTGLGNQLVATPAVYKALHQLLGALAVGAVPSIHCLLAWSSSVGLFSVLPKEDANEIHQKCVTLTGSMNILEFTVEGVIERYVVKNPLQFMLGFWGAFLRTSMELADTKNIQMLDFLQDVCCHSSRIAIEAFR